MKILKAVEDLIMLVLNSENNHYTVTARATVSGHYVMEDIDQYRELVIDCDTQEHFFNNGMRIVGAQYKTKKPLDSVDILEMLRISKLLPENNASKSTLQEAVYYNTTGKKENPLLKAFFDLNRKKDYQIIAHRDHHRAGVILVIKESNDEFVVVNFTESVF